MLLFRGVLLFLKLLRWALSLSCFASVYMLSIGLGDLWARGGMRIAVALRLSVVSLFIIYTCFSLIHLTWIDDAMSEGGCQSHPPEEGTGLPIRNCAGSSNNLVPRVTKGERNRRDNKSILWAFVLVSGLSPFEPRVNCPCAPTPPLFILQLFLDFRWFSRMSPLVNFIFKCRKSLH